MQQTGDEVNFKKKTVLKKIDLPLCWACFDPFPQAAQPYSLLDFDAVYVFVEAVDQEVEQLLGVVLLVPLELGAEVPHQLLEAARGDH